MSDLVLSHLAGSSAILTLNQPLKRNPISPAMRAALIGALELLRKNVSVRSVILTGSGTVFCSGLDLEALTFPKQTADFEAFGDDNLADSKSIRDFYDYLSSFPKPLIAAVNGPAIAGGAGVLLVCDSTVLSEKASICFSEVKLGFVPAIVGVYLQSSIGIKKARELMLSARTVSAQESLSLGIADSVVPIGLLMEECQNRAAQFEKNGPEAMAATKLLMAAQFKNKTIHDMELAVELNSRTRISSECQEGIGAFLRKKTPAWCILK